MARPEISESLNLRLLAQGGEGRRAGNALNFNGLERLLDKATKVSYKVKGHSINDNRQRNVAPDHSELKL